MIQQEDQLNHEERSLLKTISLWNLIIPVILGVGVVFFLMYKQLDLSELSNLIWSLNTVWWLLVAIGCHVLRDLFYTWRLREMTGHAFSFKKSLQLIVIWEFASAASPTSVGGAGVALILLAQEKLSGAKTITVVLYSLVIDTIYTVAMLPLFYLMLGPVIIRPGMQSISDLDGFGLTFIVVLLFMVGYGALFFYGLFINPRGIKRFLLLLSKILLLGKFKTSLRKTAMDIIVAAKEIKEKDKSFHFKNGFYTFGAWTSRFLAINAIIFALIPNASSGFIDQLIIIARGLTMHVTTAFSPTPGGSGIVEYLFGGYFSDYIPKGVGSLVALIWRLISYYPYLLLGAIVIPIWIRNI
jgi:uncharacterized protein (TIRG00374 family)